MARRATDLRLEEQPSAQGADRFPYAPGLFMALFLTAALLLAVTNPALLESPDRSLLDGSWAAAYQERFDEESPIFESATTVWGLIEYLLFAQGRPGVLVGEEGWLYTTEEFTYPADPAVATANLTANLDRIAAVAHRLESQGSRMVVALLPAKARVYPEHLGRFELPAGPAGRFDLALAGLRQRGVEVVDLLPPLLEAKVNRLVFLRTGTHWTPLGAQAAATTVAGAVRDLASFDWLDEEEYSTSSSEPALFNGDLTSFLPLGPFYDELGPEGDLLADLETVATGPAGNDLFAEVQLPVVLVGTSYSQDERWHFAGWLRQTLGSDVLVAAERGQGPYQPMIEYLEGEAFRNAPPQLVVWEIPERYLHQSWRAADERTGEGN